MGSSGSGDGSNNTSIDASIGGLVWVRRRNGSWWPGRIMGIDELSENCLVSPRSGTPVKLLGREDASVDWYNLEKSKRVKPFRCGEYDECIEKAKASAANSSKKAVKYARREDAILHALELESARLGKEPLNFCTRLEKSGGETDGSPRDSPDMFHSGDDNEDVASDVSDSEETSNSTPEYSQSSISSEEPNHNNFKVSLHGRRRKTPNDSEDDGSEGIKRMRGLEDLGMGVVSNTKVHTGVASEIGQQSVTAPYKTNAGMCAANGTTINGEVYPSTLKRKRSQVVKVREFLKRKNRRRPLTKVLESTAMVSVPVICDELPGANNAPDGGFSGLACNGSKKSGSDMCSYSSDSKRVTENGASLNAYDNGCNMSNLNQKTKENEAPNVVQLAENCSADKLYDVPFIGVLNEEKHNAGSPPALVSCSSRRSQVDALGSQPCNGNQGEALLSGNEGLNESGSRNLVAVDVNNNALKGEETASKWQSKGKRKSRHISKSSKKVSIKYAAMDYEQNASESGNMDELTQGVSVQMVDCNEIGACSVSPDCISQKSKSVCEVQVNGCVDLRRRIRGMTAEMNDVSLTPQRCLPDPASRVTVNSRYQMAGFPGRTLCSDAGLYDVKLEVKASYRPQHVPLVSLMSKLNGKAIVGHPLTIEVLVDGFCDHLLGGSDFDLEVRPYQETPYKKLAPPSQFSTKKFKGKKSGLSYKKTRTLSSLTTGRKLLDEDRKLVIDKLKGPVIACIPLKVVFSRINEAVSGLGRATHRV